MIPWIDIIAAFTIALLIVLPPLILWEIFVISKKR